MKRAALTILLVSLIVLPFTVFADEGIPLQMDVYLGTPIYGPEDLPEEITFNLYNSKDVPSLATIVGISIECPHYDILFENEKTKGGEML